MPPFRCYAECTNMCHYSWTKNGIHVGGQTLNLGELSPSDDGTYICKASEGTKYINKSLIVHVLGKYVGHMEST